MAEDYIEDMEIKIGITPTEDMLKEVKNCEERMQMLERKYKLCPAWRSKERKNLEDRMRYEQENMKRIMASFSSGEKVECRNAYEVEPSEGWSEYKNKQIKSVYGISPSEKWSRSKKDQFLKELRENEREKQKLKIRAMSADGAEKMRLNDAIRSRTIAFNKKWIWG